MSEMQPDTVVYDDDDVVETIDSDVVETTEAEDQETDSDSSPDDTAKEQAAKPKKFTEEEQAQIDAIVAGKVKKQREAERKAEKLEQELNELKAKLPQNTRPIIPPVPDALALSESEFQRQMAIRDEAINRQAAFDAQQSFAQRQADQARQEVENAKTESYNLKAQSYTKRALQMGITPADLQSAGATIYEIGIDKALEEFILDDDQGPLITKYLANNLAELETLRNLPPVYAAARIATVVKAKASALKPKVNPAPDPVDQPRHSGGVQRQTGPKGATYE